ncbi:sucrose transporter 2 [Actinidia rufa]|uniref:Sucrose transporter 2 n=1 Tax=Actinidia rufa TaxID=165716 RepID=A0A7J0FNB5_9ERIC|nr:sucrose transporter 2 [Actinidia rufa]
MAAFVFIIGFWMLDLANNTVQGPARALLADLSGPSQRNSANAIFCSWMAVGNILGFSAGASGNWHRWFPFLTTRACCEACGNLKAAFLVAVISAPLLDDPQQMLYDLSKSQTDGHIFDNASGYKSDSGYQTDINLNNSESKTEDDQSESFNDSPGAVLVNLLTSLRHLPPAMHSVLIVMALTWLSWFPFFLLIRIGWVEKSIMGTQKGMSLKFKLMIKVSEKVVLGISSFFIEPMCQWIGARLVWAISNFIVFACMAGTAIISLVSVREYSEGIQHVIGGNGVTKIASLVVFALLGVPLSITYSVPFSVTAELTADTGGGQVKY